MTVDNVALHGGSSRVRRHTLVGAGLLLVIAAAALTWAKWDPYTHKIASLWQARAWPGGSILQVAGEPSAAPSWAGAWAFTVAYGKAVWMALAGALVIAAAVDALVPRSWVVRVLAGRGWFGGSIVGGLLAVPCMMCTCCSAPLAATLRRRGVPSSSVLAYWLGNPVLNPAVLVFLALVAPWQWVATRLVVGALLVFGVTALVARLAGRQTGDDRAPAGAAPEPAFDLRGAPTRFGRSLGRLALFLIPEYFLVVFALGAFRGWLFPIGANAAHWGVLAVVLAAIVGTLVVIPTAGEIPVLQGLTLLGLGAGPIGALLITLPAISASSMAMVGRALSWRLTAAMAGAVMVTGLLGAAVLVVLT